MQKWDDNPNKKHELHIKLNTTSKEKFYEKNKVKKTKRN